jgi:AAA15 family ATPase/GTPase
MILNISFKNFRSYKDEASFSMMASDYDGKLQNVMASSVDGDNIKVLNSALLFGANASGKSNLFKIVKEVREFVEGSKMKVDVPIPLYHPFLFDDTSAALPTCFSIEFVARNGLRYKYEIEVNKTTVLKEKLVYYQDGKETLLIERIPASDEKSLEHKGYVPIIGATTVTVFKNQLILSAFGKEYPNAVITEAYQYIASLQIELSEAIFGLRESEIASSLYETDSLGDAVNVLLQVADTGLTGIAVRKNDVTKINLIEKFPVDVEKRLLNLLEYNIAGLHQSFDKKKIMPLALTNESNGTQQLCLIAVNVLRALKEGRTLFIDEIDMSLHTNVAKLLLGLFQSERLNTKHAQLIITTHNTNLLDYTLFRKDQIWFAEKNEMGCSELFSLQDFDDVAEDTPFDKWYMAGKFGATPNIDSVNEIVKQLEAYLRGDEKETAD